MTIINDIIKEENEFFTYSLSMAIILTNPANGAIFMMDNEGMLLRPSIVKNEYIMHFSLCSTQCYNVLTCPC